MAHGDAVGHGDRAEFARCCPDSGHTLLHHLRLAHEGDIARRRLIPAGRDADEWLVDLLGRQTHRVVEGAMGRSIRPLGGVPAREFRLQTRFGVHRFCRSAPVYRCRVDPTGLTTPAWRPSMWLNGMAESRRKKVDPDIWLKCCKTVADR